MNIYTTYKAGGRYRAKSAEAAWLRAQRRYEEQARKAAAAELRAIKRRQRREAVHLKYTNMPQNCPVCDGRVDARSLLVTCVHCGTDNRVHHMCADGINNRYTNASLDDGEKVYSYKRRVQLVRLYEQESHNRNVNMCSLCRYDIW